MIFPQNNHVEALPYEAIELKLVDYVGKENTDATKIVGWRFVVFRVEGSMTPTWIAVEVSDLLGPEIQPALRTIHFWPNAHRVIAGPALVPLQLVEGVQRIIRQWMMVKAYAQREVAT